MSSTETQPQGKQRPRPLDEIEPLSSFSKENTGKSMQGSLYDCEANSMNTFALSSGRSITKRKESFSAKSRISSKNMIEFEEFVLDNPNEILIKNQNNTGLTDNNASSLKDQEAVKDVELKHNSNQSLANNLISSEVLTMDHNEQFKIPYSDNELLTLETENKCTSISFKSSEYPEIRIENQKMPYDDLCHEKVMNNRNNVLSVLADYNHQKSTNEQENPFNERIISFEDLSGRRKSEQKSAIEAICLNKSAFATEFQNLKEEVVTIQRDLKNSEAYNKKLEEYIFNQKIQIQAIIHNFNIIEEENTALKSNLHETNSREQDQKRENEDESHRERFKEVDYVISKKANRYYKEEIELMKEKQNKIALKYQKIINDLQNQLEKKNVELIELSKQKNSPDYIGNGLTKSLNTRSQPLLEHTQINKPSHSDKDLRIPDFRSKSKVKIGENNFFGTNYGDYNDDKDLMSSGHLNTQVSPTDMKYIQHMANISEKLDEIKRKDKEFMKKGTNKLLDQAGNSIQSQSDHTPSKSQSTSSQSQLAKFRVSSSMVEKSYKLPSKEFKSFSSENQKLGLQGSSTFEETSVEEGRASMAETSFDISLGKKELDESCPFNMSPSKNKQSFASKQEPRKKSHPSSQNVSQLNEMSMINETLSENFVTESIHHKISWDFQKPFALPTGPKKSTENLKAHNKIPKEDSQEKEYGYIEKMHKYIQGAKRKASNSTSNSRGSYGEKNNSKDLGSLQRSKEETIIVSNNYSSVSKGKDNYSSNSSVKAENTNVLKTTNLNLPTPTSNNNLQGSKQNKAPSSFDKPHDSYSKPFLKSSEKKSRSATNSQDKVVKKTKDKPENISKIYEQPPSLQTQSNETIMFINSALDKIFDKSQQNKTYQMLDKEKRFMKTQPYKKSEVIPEFDDIYPLPLQSENRNKHVSMMNTAPLSSYLQLTRISNQPDNPPCHTSQRGNLIDIENKENCMEHYPRTSVLTNKSSKQTGYSSTQINLEEQTNYNPSLEKLITIPTRSVDSSKPIGYKRSSNSSQARHQTPTTKVYLDVFPPNEAKDLLKVSKKIEKCLQPDQDEIGINTSDQFTNKLANKPRSLSNKASSSKNGTRGAQPCPNYPLFNNLVVNEYGNSIQGTKVTKTPNIPLVFDQKSYEFMHQTDRESLPKKSKDENINNKYESENLSNGSESYSGQFQAKNRRESYKPYAVYNYDSKKYS